MLRHFVVKEENIFAHSSDGFVHQHGFVIFQIRIDQRRYQTWDFRSHSMLNIQYRTIQAIFYHPFEQGYINIIIFWQFVNCRARFQLLVVSCWRNTKYDVNYCSKIYTRGNIFLNFDFTSVARKGLRGAEFAFLPR